MIKDDIVDALKAAVLSITAENTSIELEQPANPAFGDYSSSIAMKLSKQLKKNPFEIAQTIIKNFPKLPFIDKIETIKPGFINFYINNNILIKVANEINKGEFTFIPYNLGKNKKIMIEYAHPNTHKLFHIGHLRNITTGETIVRILEACGNVIVRANYQGDVGLHIAKCLYKLKGNEAEIRGLKTITDKIRFLGKAYSEGQKAFDESEEAKKEIYEINKMIYDQDKRIYDLWNLTRQWSLDYFDSIYKRVYTHYDRLYFESEMAKRSIEIVDEALKKGILEKSQGAIVFNGKKYGLDIRVFVNSLGFPTYEGKELPLAEKEFSEFGDIDKCIHLTTPEQASFFKVTFKVEELLNPDKITGKQQHLVYEWVKLKEGKMSSREGNIIEGEWLINETKNKISKQFKCEDAIAETLAIAAVKYSFLKNNVSSPIAFDINESISLEGNSGPYLLYTYVRTQSVLNKTDKLSDTISTDFNEDELRLFRLFREFPEIILKAGQNLSPNLIASYLYELAQQFNIFYQKNPILKSAEDKKNLRLMITKVTGIILKKGLNLLGINTVEKM